MSKFKIIFEFFSFLKKDKKWWLIPLIILLILITLIIIFTENSALAPFIYPLF
jgi:hypothetical protein